MTKKYDYSKAVDAFFIESREMLEDMENALLDIEKDLSDSLILAFSRREKEFSFMIIGVPGSLVPGK